MHYCLPARLEGEGWRSLVGQRHRERRTSCEAGEIPALQNPGASPPLGEEQEAQAVATRMAARLCCASDQSHLRPQTLPPPCRNHPPPRSRVSERVQSVKACACANETEQQWPVRIARPSQRQQLPGPAADCVARQRMSRASSAKQQEVKHHC